mmetsp:Transcript_50732/g.127294  ORF Transcript_50732/g.127294 Transcript_50732/m.127294 type:complete len:93 (-) Transcript_50732:1519-1797(-)
MGDAGHVQVCIRGCTCMLLFTCAGSPLVPDTNIPPKKHTPSSTGVGDEEGGGVQSSLWEVVPRDSVPGCWQRLLDGLCLTHQNLHSMMHASD